MLVRAGAMALSDGQRTWLADAEEGLEVSHPSMFGASPYADRELWSSEEEQEMWAFDLQGFVGRPTQRRLESLWPILIPRKTLSTSRAEALSATHCYIIKRRW